MKSRITKLAVAAVIIIAVLLSITFLDKSVISAYAIEQTIEALQNVSTVHMFCTSWEDNHFEVWMKLDPETGKETSLYATLPNLGYTIISEPNASYVYDENNKYIQVYDHKMAQCDMSFTNVIESVYEQTSELENGESVEIYRYNDPNVNRDFIVVSIDTKKQETKIFVDPDTKLPVRINRIRVKNMGDMLKSADAIYYDVPIPLELVNFEVPEDAKVINVGEQIELLNDPNFGISAEGLTQEEAFIKLAEEYWHAVIDADWSRVKNLRPSLGVLSTEDIKAKHRDENPPVALIEIRQPYKQRGLGIGQVTPCIVKFSDGKILEIGMITIFREINSYSYAVLYGTWGKAREIE